MNKSHSLKYRNHKSLSNLNNFDAHDVHVSNVLSTQNVDNLDTAITNLQSESLFNPTSFTGDLIPNTNELQDIGSTTKKINEIHTSNIFTTNHNVDSKLTSLSGDIQINTSNISSNGLSIGTNSSLIFTNTSDINDLQTKTGDIDTSSGNFELDTSQVYFFINTVQRLRMDSDIVLTTDTSGTYKVKQGNSIRYQINSNGNAVYNNPNHEFRVGNSTKMNMSSSNTTFSQNVNFNNIQANSDAVYNIGSSSNRFQDAFIRDGITTGSDERDKYYIQSLEEDKMVQFIKDLNPVRYKWKSEKDKEKTPRFHTGLLAQDVKKKIPFDSGLLIHDTETDKYGLRYQELISVLISVNQNLIKRLELLESKF